MFYRVLKAIWWQKLLYVLKKYIRVFESWRCVYISYKIIILYIVIKHTVRYYFWIFVPSTDDVPLTYLLYIYIYYILYSLDLCNLFPELIFGLHNETPTLDVHVILLLYCYYCVWADNRWIWRGEGFMKDARHCSITVADSRQLLFSYNTFITYIYMWTDKLRYDYRSTSNTKSKLCIMLLSLF